MLFADDAVVVTEGDFASREGTVISVAGECCWIHFADEPAGTKSIRIKTTFLRPKQRNERHTRARIVFVLCSTLYSCSHSVCSMYFFPAILRHDVVTIPLEDFQTWINTFEDREGVDMVVVRSRGTGLQVRIVDGGE